MKSRKKLTGIILAGLMLLTACGKKPAEAPELLEPVATNEAYRTVEYGNVGDYNLYYGIIVPTDYCQFFSTATNIKEIKVKVGDYVEKGDVLAVADIESITEAINAINVSLEQQDKINALNDQKYEYDLAYMKDLQSTAAVAGDSATVESLGREIAVMEENHRYDLLMRNKQKAASSEELNELKALISDGRLVADTSGYVSYVKDLSGGTYVNSTENVVIISDLDDRYISVIDTTVDMDILKNANLVCTYEDGERINLEEYKYSSETVFAAENKKQKLTLRMKYEEGRELPEIGETIPIYVSKNVVENVLIVGNDSIVEDEEGYLVYVQNGDGKESRRIELGVRDDNYSEVVSGLSEGERIYYITDRAIIRDYTPYVVEKSDYRQVMEINDDYYSIINTNDKYYYSDYEGRITELAVQKGDTVRRGDLICKVDTSQGSAYLIELKKNIENFKENHTNTVEANNNQRLELEGELATLEATSREYKDAKLSLDKLMIDIELEDLQYNYQLANMQDEYDAAMKNNDGKGVMSIYATGDGVVKQLYVSDGKFINAGGMIAMMSEEGERQLVITSDKLEPVIGTKITIYNTHTDETYIGNMYGICSNYRNYATTKNDRIYITSNTNGIAGGYIDITDDELLDILPSCRIEYQLAEIKNVIVIPRELVHVEEDTTKTRDNKKYYVWKVVDDEIVKQYIRIAPTLVSDMNNYYVIAGLEVGDTLAGEAE